MSSQLDIKVHIGLFNKSKQNHSRAIIFARLMHLMFALFLISEVHFLYKHVNELIRFGANIASIDFFQIFTVTL